MSLAIVRNILVSDSELSAIVGDNVFVGFATQEIEAPFIILEEGWRKVNDCKDSASVIDDYTIVSTVVSEQYKELETILNRVKELLNNYEDEIFRGVRFRGNIEKYDGIQDSFVKTQTYGSLINVV